MIKYSRRGLLGEICDKLRIRGCMQILGTGCFLVLNSDCTEELQVGIFTNFSVDSESAIKTKCSKIGLFAQKAPAGIFNDSFIIVFYFIVCLFYFRLFYFIHLIIIVFYVWCIVHSFYFNQLFNFCHKSYKHGVPVFCSWSTTTPLPTVLISNSS